MPVPWIYMALSVPAGFLLGVFFFGGLWLTVRRLTGSSSPGLLVLVSFLARSAAVLAGFYLLLQQGWQLLPAALAGFIAARMVLASRLKSKES